jgi:uracil-DNA glycosylase
MITRDEAIKRANAHLLGEGSSFVAHAGTALPNPIQDLWIVGYRDPQEPDVILSGGGLVVPSVGPVRPISSVPGQPELLGVEYPPDEEDAWLLPEDWDEVLGQEIQQPYWSELIEYVDSERAAHRVYPPAEDTFTALRMTPYAGVRAVILGQDPYHRPGQAHGLCFSVRHGVRLPPSLRKIHRELADDLGITPPGHGNLESWARQGVLLLNTTLTVREGEPKSHVRRGWEEFTNAVIAAVNAKQERVVFILWGDAARAKARGIDTERHGIVEAAHPAARANASTKFLGSKPFSRTNELLQDAGRKPIAWAIPDATP